MAAVEDHRDRSLWSVLWGLALGMAIWVALVATVMVVGPEGYDPFPSPTAPVTTNLFRSVFHFAGIGAFGALFAAVAIEGAGWARARRRGGGRRERASWARLGVWTAHVVLAGVVLVGLGLGRGVPCVGRGSSSGLGSSAVRCVEDVSPAGRVAHAAFVTGWFSGPVGLVVGAGAGSAVATVTRRRRPTPAQLQRQPPPA